MVTLAMVTYLDRACIGAMKQHIAADFSLDDAQMGWVFTSFILAYAIFEIPTARWADRHGAGAVLTRIVTLVVGVHAHDRRRVQLRVAAGHAIPVRCGRSRRLSLRGPRAVALGAVARTRHGQGNFLRRRLCVRAR